MHQLMTDEITIAPDICGTHGTAWRIDLHSINVERKCDEFYHREIIAWLVQAPYAHPYWHSYALVFIHLRPVEFIETRRYLANATHEVWLFALDPVESREKFVQTGQFSILRPGNFAAQFVAESDDAVKETAQCVARDMCIGKLNPDTDYIQQWIQRFGNNMMVKK